MWGEWDVDDDGDGDDGRARLCLVLVVWNHRRLHRSRSPDGGGGGGGVVTNTVRCITRAGDYENGEVCWSFNFFLGNISLGKTKQLVATFLPTAAATSSFAVAAAEKESNHEENK